jgi:hypothetical protein
MKGGTIAKAIGKRVFDLEFFIIGSIGVLPVVRLWINWFIAPQACQEKELP